MKAETTDTLLVTTLVVLGIPLVLAISFFGGGAIVYGAWNYGVVAVADVPPVGYWPACFLSLGIGVIRSFWRSA